MKLLLVGTGGVGEAIATIIHRRDAHGEWLERMVLSDHSIYRVRKVSERLADKKRFPAEKLDARNKEQIVALAKKYEVDLIVNGCSPYNMFIFEAAYESHCHYLDMALSLSQKHPQDPYNQCYVKLGDEQFAQSQRLGRKGPAGACRFRRRAGNGRCTGSLRREILF